MAAYTNTTMVADDADLVGFVGANVAAGWTVAMADDVGVQAEAFICNLIRYDAVTNWALIGAIEKLMMTELVLRTIAVAAISYDMAAYTSRIEAENMVNLHLYRINEITKLLSDQKVLTHIQAGTP